ncbi:MAG: hypothetical protein ACLFMV_08005 [Spirochaetaceae bacterium]
MSSSRRRSTTINLPIRVVFTDEGLSYFMRHNRALQRLHLSDDRDEYGVKLEGFSAPTLQKLLLSGYISEIELPVSSLTAQRSAIIDFTKLLTYGMLYLQFDTSTYAMLLNSPMVKHWNRRNVRNPIDFRTRVDTERLESLLEQHRTDVGDARRDILEAMQERIRTDDRLIDQEKRIRLLAAERYLDSMSRLSWLILALYRNTDAYARTIPAVRDELGSYVEKTVIGEYFALMLIEVLTTMQAHDRHEYVDVGSRGEMYVLFKTRKDLTLEHDRGRLHVVVADDRANFDEVQNALREKSKTTVRRKSLSDFYEAELGEATAESPELGLYYVSFVQEACRNVNIHFQSFVHQIETTGKTLVNLVLTF